MTADLRREEIARLRWDEPTDNEEKQRGWNAAIERVLSVLRYQDSQGAATARIAALEGAVRQIVADASIPRDELPDWIMAEARAVLSGDSEDADGARLAYYTSPANPDEARTGRVRTWDELTEDERDHWRRLSGEARR